MNRWRQVFGIEAERCFFITGRRLFYRELLVINQFLQAFLESPHLKLKPFDGKFLEPSLNEHRVDIVVEGTASDGRKPLRAFVPYHFVPECMMGGDEVRFKDENGNASLAFREGGSLRRIPAKYDVKNHAVIFRVEMMLVLTPVNAVLVQLDVTAVQHVADPDPGIDKIRTSVRIRLTG
jgi:hypothetical protein